MTERTYQPGEFIVRECGEVKTSDGEMIKGAIIEFPAGPPGDMTFADVWNGTAFVVARLAKDDIPPQS